jgi:integrase
MDPQNMGVFTVDTVIEELLASRERRGVSTRWLYSLENTLCRFSEFVNGPLAGVSPADCDAFIASLNLAPRSRNNIVGMLRQLFRFALKRRYVPPDFLPLATLELSLVRASEVQLYTPEELQRILAHSGEVWPLVVLTAFCGVRWSEASRLTWADVDTARGVVFIQAGKAKTRSRRVCMMPDCAREWLLNVKVDDCRQTLSLIWPHSLPRSWRSLESALLAAGVRPQRNGLRHSFISYRLAIVQDAAKVSLEAGTSPQMIFSNYRELVTSEQARAWFEVFPANASQLAFDFAA